MQFEDGRRFVNIDQDQDRFIGHDRSEYPVIAKLIISQKFQGKVIGLENKAFVNGSGRDEYIHPSKYLKNADLYDTKMLASPELDNLIDAGVPLPSQSDGRDGHKHDGVENWEYYETLFKIGDNFFKGVINIKKSVGVCYSRMSQK